MEQPIDVGALQGEDYFNPQSGDLNLNTREPKSLNSSDSMNSKGYNENLQEVNMED